MDDNGTYLGNIYGIYKECMTATTTATNMQTTVTTPIATSSSTARPQMFVAGGTLTTGASWQEWTNAP